MPDILPDIPNLFERSADSTPSVAPKHPGHRLLFDAVVGAISGVGSVSVCIAWGWQAYSPSALRTVWASDPIWTAVLIGSALIALVYICFGAERIWREARRRVTPWVVAIVTLWVLVQASLKYGPAAAVAALEPHYGAVFAALVATAIFVGIAGLALIDGYSDRRSDRPRDWEKY